eukprot:TRINITY_DN10177_c0_g1_i1.p1 TRINITY_DN10177_c0_g1~~TRINITY_DN10177_c0_g1_i1.p1  ORF type:complete len:740 (+),score=141.02 TRINITY_DN10177_c0_g1_i1:29-2221(+)
MAGNIGSGRQASTREQGLREQLSQAQSDVDSCAAALEAARRDLLAAKERRDSLQAELEDFQLQRDSATTSDTWSQKQNWTTELCRVCEDIFGVTSFRENQEEALNALLSSRDVFLVAPTGAGKSLCFQVPSILQKNLTVVVSPLLALMHDQVMSLRAVGVGAEMLSSNDAREEQTRIRNAMKAIAGNGGESSLRVLYVTPERLAKSKLVLNILEKIYASGKLGLIAIDEAHCISQWGHDFRQDYEKLAALRVQFPKTPILALTATATNAVANNVQQILGMSGAVELRAATNRPNLFYAVRHRPKSASDMLQVVLAAIRLFPSGTPGLVYCITRKEAESVCDGLRSGGVHCAYYHGDLDADARQRVHEKWVEGEVSVIVATVAFGMGINKSDIRFVIHAGMPASLHHYYQEAGRAGRDGEPALCLLFYRPSDVTRHSVMNYYKPASLRESYGAAMYCQGWTCRRAIIAKHFGEEVPSCNRACDVCWARDASSKQAAALQEVVESRPLKKQRSAAEGGKLDSCRHPPAQAWQCTLRLALEAKSNDELLTLAKLGEKVQKACKWRGDAASEDALYVVLSLLASGYLREEFRHSPYATNAYLVATRRSERVVSELEEVTAEVRELGAVSALHHSPVELGPVEGAARAAASLRAGGFSSGDRMRHNAVARRLQRLRMTLGSAAKVPGQFVLTDKEVAALAALRTPTAVEGLSPLCGAKRCLYGKAVLACLQDNSS